MCIRDRLGSYAVNHGLQVVSFDVSQAFLQGLLLKDLEKRGEMKRTVFFDPPKDAWNILWKSMPDKFSLLSQIRSTQEVTLQAIKGVYGLGDAPRLWRERFHEWMMSQGFTQSKFDECFYFMKCFKGSRENRLLVTMHVDDCEVAGTPTELKRFKAALVKQFGDVKEQAWDYRHCGIEYHQDKTTGDLTFSQKEFVDQMQFFPLGKERRKQRSSPLTAVECTGFRSVLGGLQWCTHTRADHSAECSRLQSKRAVSYTHLTLPTNREV